MSQALRTAVVIALLPVLLVGCGTRGSLEAPHEAKQKGTATSADAADAGTNSSAPPKPHRDFLLDPLVR